MITIKRVSSKDELNAIAELQHLNLRQNISTEEALGQGFLTAEYSMDVLEGMHAQEPAIIAMDGNTLAGYALVATKSTRNSHPLLADLFAAIDRLEYKNTPLKGLNYVVVGQLCVAREFRGQGLVSKLYNQFRDSLAGNYIYCVTDVATTNQRSLNAHSKAGFTVINHTEYAGVGWEVVLWNWRQES
jgi:ribosomal protein S18 acetylase RimI-like enzyme